MEELPNIPDKPQIDKGGKLWKTLLLTFLGTTMSILLTFGTSQLVAQHRRVQERKLTAMMVIGNIEQYAQKLEMIHEELSWRDTLAVMLLAIPKDSLDEPRYSDMVNNVALVAAAPGFNYDKSVEQIFSNSIETWKNMGNFKFIDNVGKCFSSMTFISDDYMEFVKQLGEFLDEVKNHRDNYPGKSLRSKVLHSESFRSDMLQLHRRASYYLYLSDYIRYLNAINMQLMGVTEEEVLQFISNREEEVEIDREIPWQQDYITPAINPDSLPDYQTWIQTHKI